MVRCDGLNWTLNATMQCMGSHSILFLTLPSLTEDGFISMLKASEQRKSCWSR